MEDFELDAHHLEMAGIDPNDNGEGDANNEQVSGQNSSSQGGEGSQQQQTQTGEQQAGVGEASVGGKQDGGNQQGKKQEGQGAADPELKAGDIRLQDGTIVRAGAERRHFENSRILKTEVGDLKNQLNTSNQKYTNLETKYNELKTTVSQLGFEEPARVSAAVRLYKDLAANPVETMTKLLAELKGKGHTFDGIGGTVDTLAIQNMLVDSLPQQQQQQQTPEQVQQRIQEEAAQEALEFLGQFPDARMHEGVIANILEAATQQGQSPSLRDVYFRLRQSVAANGLDWDKPLQPQIDARKQAQSQQQQQQQPGTQKPFNGVRGGMTVETQSENIDPFKTSTGNTRESAILDAMRENGYNYQR